MSKDLLLSQESASQTNSKAATKKMLWKVLKTHFQQELNFKYGIIIFKEYFTQVTLKEAADDLTILGKKFNQLLDNLTGNSVNNMVKDFKGDDPISDIEKSIVDIMGPIAKPLVHSIKNNKKE